MHPNLLTAYVKSNIAANDTALIHIDLISGNNIVDSGNFYETSSHSSYRKIEIPISQNSAAVDSALICIEGSIMLGTTLYVDDIGLVKN